MSAAEQKASRERLAVKLAAKQAGLNTTTQQQQQTQEAIDAATLTFQNLQLQQKAAAAATSSSTPTSTYTPQSGSLVYRSDTIDKAALAQQITALNGGVTPSTAGRAKVVVAPSPPPPQRTAEEIKAHLDRKFKAIHAAYKAAAPKTDEELRAEVMAVIRKVEKKTMSIQDVKAYTKQRDIAQYLRRDKFTDAMLATRIQKRVDEDDDDDSVSY